MSIAQDAIVSAEALSALGHGVVLVGEDGVVLRWGGTLVRHGIPPREAEGRSFLKVIGSLAVSGDLLPSIQDAFAGAVSSGKSGVVKGVTLNLPTQRGKRFNLLLTPSVGSAGTAVVVFEDVTEELRVREQFERILDSTPDGIFVIDPDRRVRLFNRACGTITGRSPEEILSEGCTCEGVVNCHNEEGESYAHGLCPARSVFGGEVTHQSEEMLLTNAHGEERWVETNYSAVLGEDGSVEYVIGILRDVHERKSLEDRLHQTEKLASFGQLVAGIAHEIKNPLAIIQSSLDVLDNGQRPPEQRAEAVQFIREEVRRMDDRLRSFLAFARPQALSARSLLLSGFVQRRLAPLTALFPQINVQVETIAPEPLLLADDEQLNQVLTNLFLNAGEATPPGGTIRLRTRQQGGHAVLEIEDSGPGIPEAQRVRIFDPFYTTKADGTGLGLSICYQIILAHRGTISVSSSKLGGACFTVRLPMSNAMM
jgi:PAS domain S-box-containing protein